MSQIIIHVNALGYIGEDYEELEVNQQKKLTKDSIDSLLTEKDCREIIQTMIDAVRKNKLLFPDEQNLQLNKLFSIKFHIVCAFLDGRVQTFEEETFFNEAVAFDSLKDVLLEYVEVTDKGDEGTRIWIPENESYESHPAGTFAIIALVMRDKKWISTYIDFLRTNDLDHEMMQVWHIKSIIEKYGWCEETSKLAIARNVSCCGQGGRKQFDLLMNNGLEAYISVVENRKQFIQNILNEFDGWDKIEFRLKEASEKQYESYVISYVKHFEAYLVKEELQQIEMYLWQKWNMFHAT